MMMLTGYIGIGAAIAIELARRGASVLITYVSSAKKAETVVDVIQNHRASAHAIQADSANAAESAQKIITECGTIFSDGIDIIVNNAADGSDISLTDVTTDNFDRVFHVNVLFPLLLIQGARKFLRRGARIVNISSTTARRGKACPLNCTCTKHRLNLIYQHIHRLSHMLRPRLRWRASRGQWRWSLVSRSFTRSLVSLEQNS